MQWILFLSDAGNRIFIGSFFRFLVSKRTCFRGGC